MINLIQLLIFLIKESHWSLINKQIITQSNNKISNKIIINNKVN